MSTYKVAYLRASNNDDEFAKQEASLEPHGPFHQTVKETTLNDSQRFGFERCIEYLRSGDTLYCTRADRLCKSKIDLLNTITKLKRKNVDVVFVEQPELLQFMRDG